MKRPTSEKLQLLRAHYTAGSRVRLLQMDDPYRPDLKAGAMGTVIGVDDAGNILVNWDCGSSLGVLYGVDSCTVVEGRKQND